MAVSKTAAMGEPDVAGGVVLRIHTASRHTGTPEDRRVDVGGFSPWR
jgi:hypothetical protein